MTSYISMLRGINVSGQKPVRMEKLVALYISLGFKRVQTYIQSGNAVFESSADDPAELSRLIEKRLKQSLGFDIPVIIRTAADFRKITQGNPFNNMDNSKLHITFLESIPDKADIEEISRARDGSEDFQLSGREVYLYCPNGYGRTRLSNQFLERILKVRATTRNWKTVLVLARMAEELQAEDNG